MKRKGPRRAHKVPRAAPKVVPKRLRKYHAWADNKLHEIWIDEKLTGRAKLEAFVHEWLHLYSWAVPEETVRRVSRGLVAFLHKNHVRIIEQGNAPLDLEKLLQ